MDNHLRDVLVWAIVCLTALGLGSMYLTGIIHHDDNKVRIEQIRKP